jgi:hypothetical protein
MEQNQVRTEVRQRAAFWLAAIALATLHVSLTNHFIPFRAVFSQTPLHGVDYDLHVGQIYRVVEALERWGKTWLYDPKLLAGHPEGTITDSGSKGWELWTYALHALGVPVPVAFNSFVLVIMLGAPLLMYAAARSFRSSPTSALIAAAMTSALWFFDSLFHWLWFIGMVSWAGASCLAVLILGLFLRMLDSSSLKVGVSCILGLSIGLLIHPYTFFALAPAMAVSYLPRFRTLPRRVHAMISAMVVCAIATNLFWLQNATAHWHYILNSAFYAQAAPSHLLCDLLDVLCSGTDTGVIGTRTAFRFIILALSIGGLAVWWRARDRRFWPLCVGIAVLYTGAYFAELTALQQTQPYRQIAPAALLSVLPAAFFLEWIWRKRLIQDQARASRYLLLVLTLALTQQLLAGQVLYFLPRLMPEMDPLIDGSRSPLSQYGFWWPASSPNHVHYGVPHESYLEPGVEATIGWLENNLPARTRVLVEGGLLGERLAWRTQLEILGGFLERNVMHVDANYFRERASGTPRDLAQYVQTYAVEWVVSNQKQFKDAADLFALVDIVEGRAIYRTRPRVDRVLQGGGRVAASSNTLDVHGSDPLQPLVLSYHWHEDLRCQPACRVERENRELDRVGLIRVPAPHPTDLTIFNSYEPQP